MDGIKSQGFSGPIQMLCDASNQAELMAAAIGITIANQTFGATTILIQSDCVGVRNLIRKASDRQSYLGHISTPLHLRFKHVKGHTQLAGARFWANRWCDHEARSWMRKERERATA